MNSLRHPFKQNVSTIGKGLIEENDSKFVQGKGLTNNDILSGKIIAGAPITNTKNKELSPTFENKNFDKIKPLKKWEVD